MSVHGLVGRGFRAPNLNDLGALGLNDLGYEVPAASTIDAGALIGASDGEGVLSTGRAVAELESERLMNYELGLDAQLGPAVRARAGIRRRAAVADRAAHAPVSRRTRVPSTLAGVPVTPIAQTAAQAEQGVVSVATGLDPRAVKAFVNDGSARYYGIDALARYRFAGAGRSTPTILTSSATISNPRVRSGGCLRSRAR